MEINIGMHQNDTDFFNVHIHRHTLMHTHGHTLIHTYIHTHLHISIYLWKI